MQPSCDTPVKMLSGRHKGRRGYFLYISKPHPLGSEDLHALSIQTGWGWVTLRTLPKNYEVINA